MLTPVFCNASRNRERETARKLQFSSLEGNHCKVFCAKQHPPSPSNYCFFQSQKSKHANRHVHVLCPSSHWPFLPPPWQQPLFTSRAGPTSIPLFINLHSPCPTLVIRLSFLWMFQFCRYDKMRKCKMWRKKMTYVWNSAVELPTTPLAPHRL